MKTISVLGDGAWGTAIAHLLANNGVTVNLWCYNESVCQNIRDLRVNQKYLPGVMLSELIQPTTSLQKAIQNVDWIFEAIPIKYMRPIIRQLQPDIHHNHRWVVLSKGIEQETLLFPGQIIDDVFHNNVQKIILAGPSFAHELATKQLTAVIGATANYSLFNELRTLLDNDYFKLYYSSDLVGVHVGAALKNIIAMLIGIIDGAGYGQNTKAFLLIAGLQEIILLNERLGGQKDTIYGLSGIGDLVLTALSNKSKNYQIGQSLGKGVTLASILKETSVVPEGINTIVSVKQLIDRSKIDLPIFYNIYRYIFESMPLDLLLKKINYIH